MFLLIKNIKNYFFIKGFEKFNKKLEEYKKIKLDNKLDTEKNTKFYIIFKYSKVGKILGYICYQYRLENNLKFNDNVDWGKAVKNKPYFFGYYKNFEIILSKKIFSSYDFACNSK